MPDVKNMWKYAVIVGALAVVVLMIIAVVTQYSKEVRTDTTVAVTGLTVPAVNATTTLTGYPFVQSLTGCVNDSAAAQSYDASYYTVIEGDATAGKFRNLDAGTNFSGDTINCSTLRYLAASDGQAAGDKFVTGLTIFGTFVGVIVLALIGVIIVSLYKKKD